MKKIIYGFLLGIVLISHSLYAGMAQTNECVEAIKRLESEIKKLEKEKIRLQELIKETGQWASLPLIPEFVLAQKLKRLEQTIKKLQSNDIDGQISSKGEELERQQRRLHVPERIEIIKIKVSSQSKWDSGSDPDIAIYLGNRRIDSVQDQSKHTFDLYEDATEETYLNIWDLDPLVDELMAKVPLDKFKHLVGVSGDYVEKEVNGNAVRGNDFVTAYWITYKVYF